MLRIISFTLGFTIVREPAPKGTIETDFPKRRFPDLKPSERRIRGKFRNILRRIWWVWSWAKQHYTEVAEQDDSVKSQYGASASSDYQNRFPDCQRKA
ncbi:hypothetical protein pipiens_019435 [Culex pipiens pipiens]|uniref:Uncharacterized protein n=1 Tax=Culex pipiens pipiens TaxID=38569 RepID=A0ABD1DUV9_CULPP